MSRDPERSDHRDLEIDEDIAYQRAEWRFQRIARLGLAVLLALAVLGVFGGGPLSAERRASPDGRFEVRFERFVRRDAPTRIRIVCLARCATPLEITLSADYLDAVELVSVTPAPVSVVALAGATRFAFTTEGEGAAVDLDLSPRRAGTLRPTIRLGPSPPLALVQLSWY